MLQADPAREASTREHSLDTVRGALLITMALNHIPSVLRPFTDQPFGYVSSAEGFVFLSGLVAGKVYTRRLRASDGTTLVAASFKRALKIYRAHAWTFLGVFIWSWSYRLLSGQHAAGSPAHFIERPLASLGAGMLFLYQPGLLDVLPLYFGMMLLLPIVLRQFERDRVALVLSVSATWWALTNLFDPTPYESGIVFSGAFNFGAWQLLFVLGLWLGHGNASGYRTLPRPTPGRVAVVVLNLLCLFAIRHGHLGIAEADWLTNKINLAPLRLVNVMLLSYLVKVVLDGWPALVRSPLLAMIGRQSLVVFSVHVVVASVVLGLHESLESRGVATWLGPSLLITSMVTAAWIVDARTATARSRGR